MMQNAAELNQLMAQGYDTGAVSEADLDAELAAFEQEFTAMNAQQQQHQQQQYPVAPVAAPAAWPPAYAGPASVPSAPQAAGGQFGGVSNVKM